MKQIQFTSGCPNNCNYCHEPKEIKTYYPDIPEGEDIVKILDMNFLANPYFKFNIARLKKAKNKHYELICGVDYRVILDLQYKINICSMLKEARFIKIRWAWDYTFSQQKIHKNIWRTFLKAGYKAQDLEVFILVNWKVPYTECCKKLDLLKIWNVKVADCCWDGGYKIAKPVYWKPEHIKSFRAKCRKHNQMIKHNLDPEYWCGTYRGNKTLKTLLTK